MSVDQASVTMSKKEGGYCLDPDKIMLMPVFKSGMKVMYEGREHHVDHVVVRGFELFVCLQGHEKPINSERIYVNPTAFSTVRRF